MFDQSRIKTTTLGELGARLPIGVPAGGRFHREIEGRVIHSRDEREIGEFRAKTKKLTPGRLISQVLSLACPQIGPYRLESMKDVQRVGALSQMCATDVLYAYFWLRVLNFGGEMDLNLECPACREQNEVEIDLNDLDVTYVEGDEEMDLTSTVVLREELRVRDIFGKNIRICQLPWYSWDSPKLAGAAGRNKALREVVLTAASIQAIDGHELVVTPDDLDDMTAFDKAMLMAAIDAACIGPRLAIDTECPDCGNAWRQPVEWSHDLFFRPSSQCRAGKSSRPNSSTSSTSGESVGATQKE